MDMSISNKCWTYRYYSVKLLLIQALSKKSNEVEKNISSCETLPCFDSNA